MAGDSEQTMADIAAAAEQRAQSLIDRARTALDVADKALAEADGSPVFSNGIAKGLRDAHQTVKATDSNLQNLKVLIGKAFRGEDVA